MDPIQLQLMQQMGMGQVPGIPGMAPLTTRGSDMLAATAGMYASPIAGNSMPDISPLAPLGLQRFGMIGMLANVVGNASLTGMMQNQGVLPMGNAGSYMQAYRTREFQKMQQEVGSRVASQDADSFYRTFRGGAALLGMPFNRQQREAAHDLANTIAEFGPTLAIAAPQVLDALAGERGSVHAMAGQMMEANRYRIDPTTGRMGYGTDANADRVKQVFDSMFSADNLPRMQGLRAGDMGQLYRRLSDEGLAGPQGSLRERTLRALNEARDSDQLDAIGEAAGLDVGGNLAELSNAELQKLRETSPMKERMTNADARQISSQLQEYVGTLAAMREVFGENGNPNAPIPQLIGALEALTSGQMHKFDASRLQMMVRDMQALSQMSGKSVDQIMAMNQSAAAQGQAFGLGTTFAPTATNVGILTGMAFQERGGATGFGAYSREEAEQAGMSYFNRGMASEMSNALGALGRIEQAGGFSDNDAGLRLSAIMEAARNGEQTYIDPSTGRELKLPTREAEFRSLIGEGAAVGVNRTDFNMMLSDRTSNLRLLHDDPELQQAAFQNQAREVNSRITRQISNRLSSSDALKNADLSNRERNAASRAMAQAANRALNDLTAQEEQDPDTRNRAIADALQLEAANQNIKLSDQAAMNMAPSVYGQAENATKYFGFDSHTQFKQLMGPQVSEARNERAAQSRARANLNQAMSGLGPQGGLMQRFFTAVQKQGDRGGDANLKSLMMDMFGTDMDQAKELMLPELQAIADERNNIQELADEIEGATPERRRELRKEIRQRTDTLETRVQSMKDLGEDFGMGGGEGVFNREDIMQSRSAARNLEHFNRSDQVRMLAATTGEVSETERANLSDEKLTGSDLQALAVQERQKQLDQYQNLDQDQIEKLSADAKQLYKEVLDRTGNEDTARARVQEMMIDSVGSVDEISDDLREVYGSSTTIGGLSKEEQNAIVRARRSSIQIAPDKKQITKRREELQEALGEPGELDAKRSNELTQAAEEQLLAENQLKALGQLEDGQSLMADGDDLRGFSGLDDKLRDQLADAKVQDRAGIVSKYMDRQLLNKFYGKDEAEVEKNRVAARTQLSTAEGKQAVKDTAANLSTMIDTRREFLLDEDAATRLGAARSLRAVKRSREAEEGLQNMANKYYNGSIEEMLVSGGQGMDAEGAKRAEEEYSKLTGKQREEVAARLTEAGKEVTAGKVTAQDYKAYIALKGRDHVDELNAANRELEGAADESLLAEELGVNQNQLDSLQSLATLETRDVTDAAKKLGMTEDEYREAMRGGEIDKNLRLFSGKDAAKQLREAKSDEDRVSHFQVKLQQVQAEIKKTGGSDMMRREEELLKRDIAGIEERRGERMKAAGLDPSKAEDVQTYKKRLQSQGDLQVLEQRQEEYMKARQDLKDKGLDDKQIDEKLGTMKEKEEEAQELLADFRKMDLSRSDLAIAESFGIDTTSVNEDLTAFKEGLGGGGPGSVRTQAMVAGALDRVEDMDIGDADSTAIEKLDMLTDQYAEATGDERKALAQKHGMDIKDLDRMMSQTEFMGMRQDEGEYTTDDFKAAMERVRGRDISAEVAEEEERQMKLTGTITIRGVVNGEGTVDDMTGTTVR